MSERMYAASPERREPGFMEEVLAEHAHMLRYAFFLAHNMSDAEDLVQTTYVQARVNEDTFTRGTNLRAWLFTILRNTFLTGVRRQKMGNDSRSRMEPVRMPQPDASLELKETLEAMQRLSPEHQEVLMLIGVNQLPYEEVAAITGVPLGTVKSRASRARSELYELTGRADPR